MLSPLIEKYKGFLIDLDGCVWVGDIPTKRAIEALAAIRAQNRKVIFFTNDVRYSPEDFVQKLWRLGFQASLNEMVTVGSALQFALADQQDGEIGRTAFVVGTVALIDHVSAAGLRVVNNTEFASRADVVVVGCHDRFSYLELEIAVKAVIRGAKIVGTTRDPIFPGPNGSKPGSGALLAAIEYATGKQASYCVGKPEPTMYATALDRLKLEPVLAIGDSVDIDILGANRSGLDSALVLTGNTIKDPTPSLPTGSLLKPKFVRESLAQLVLQ